MKALDDIEALLKQLKDRGAEIQAFEGLLTGIESALSDLVDLLEKRAGDKPLDIAPLVEAVKGLKLTAPTVQVNVPKADPPTVVVNPTLHAGDWSRLEIKFNKGRTGNGPLESCTVEKIK